MDPFIKDNFKIIIWMGMENIFEMKAKSIEETDKTTKCKLLIIFFERT